MHDLTLFEQRLHGLTAMAGFCVSAPVPATSDRPGRVGFDAAILWQR